MNRFVSLQSGGKYLAVGLAMVLAFAYTFFNLHAAWDPATNLSNIRAGLVNLDEPFTPDGGGAKVAVGEDLAKTLMESKTFGWRSVSQADAERLTRSGGLDFYLLIPKDTSKRVAGLPTAGAAGQPTLSLAVNPAYNYPMNSIADSVTATIREQLNGKISAVYLERLLEGLGGAVTGVAKAADGARKIADGAKAADDGAGKLADGLDQAKSGADQLYAGMQSVEGGAGAIARGAVQVRDGNRKLASGMDQAATGARALSAGAGQLEDGVRKLANGYGTIANGNQQLTAGLGQAVDGVREMKRRLLESMDKEDPVLSDAGARIQDAIKNLILRRPALVLDKDFKMIIQQLQRLDVRADELKKESVDALVGGLNQLDTGLVSARDGARQLAEGARGGYQQGQAAVEGAGKLRDGAAQLAVGVQQGADGARQLATGADALAKGANDLYSGTGRLRTGGASLVSGLGQLRDGGQQLATGLDQLSGGTEQLATGLGGASSAAVPPKENAGAMSQPVKVVGQKVTPVPRPGEALLGLIIPSSLWLGAMVLMLGLRLAGGVGAASAGEGPLRRLWAMKGAAIGLSVAVVGTALLMMPSVAHPILLMLFVLVTAFSYIAINQMLVRVLGLWGLAVSAVLAILMPVAVGARAPYILLPGVYRALAPAMPLTHGIRGVQATVAGGAWDIFWVSVAALAVLTLLALGLSRWLGKREAAV